MIVQIEDNFGDPIALLKIKSGTNDFNKFFQNYKAMKYELEEKTKESADEPEGLLDFMNLLNIDVERVFIEETVRL